VSDRAVNGTAEVVDGVPTVVVADDLHASSTQNGSTQNGLREPRSHSKIQTRPTVRLDPTDLKPSWAIIGASLEQIAGWAGLALRLGTLALVQECVRDLARPDAGREGIARLRELVDALAHMPFDA
jgi:hypothetical protein